jgi:hypothetical protein
VQNSDFQALKLLYTDKLCLEKPVQLTQPSGVLGYHHKTWNRFDLIFTMFTMAIAVASGNIAQCDGASAHRVLLGPGPCSFLVALPLVLVHVSNLWDKGVVWVGVGEERADGEQDL